MGTKWVTLWKDTSERKLKPAASSSLQAAVCCHIQGVERKGWMWTSSVGTKVLGSLPVLTLHFPSSGLQLQKWNQTKFCRASAQASETFVSKNTWCCKWRQTQTTDKVPTVKWNSDFVTRSSRNTPGLPEVIRETFSLHWCRRGQILSSYLVLCLSIQSPAPL